MYCGDEVNSVTAQAGGGCGCFKEEARPFPHLCIRKRLQIFFIYLRISCFFIILTASPCLKIVRSAYRGTSLCVVCYQTSCLFINKVVHLSELMTVAMDRVEKLAVCCQSA